MKKCPHIIIFNPDEMRWDTMGHMGNSAASTPFLDRIYPARRRFLSGMLFARIRSVYQAVAVFLQVYIHMSMDIVP